MVDPDVEAAAIKAYQRELQSIVDAAENFVWDARVKAECDGVMKLVCSVEKYDALMAALYAIGKGPGAPGT